MLYKLKIIVAAIILALLPGCSKQSEKKWRIGISQCSNDDWRKEMNDEIYREMMFHDDTEVEIRSAEDQNEKQIKDIRYFMDNGFDLIIVAPNEAAALTPVINEAYNKGIPIITFDRDISGDYYTAHMEIDNYGLGHSAAKYAVNILPQRARIIEVQGMEDMSPTRKRHAGFTEEIDRHPELSIVASVYGNWDEKLTSQLVDSLLDVYPDLDLIYAHNDRMAISASQTARRKGRHGIKFLGIDGTVDIGIKAVADSIIDATFLYPTEGGRIIRMAIAILKGEPYNREELVAPLSPVDRSNADILLQQSALQKGEIEKIRILHAEMDDYLVKHANQSTLLYATVAIIILFLIIFFLILRAFWQANRHHKILLEQNKQLEEQRDRQKELYQKLDDATQSKLVFFTNVSHDLRTPLTLISESIDQVIENKENLSSEQKQSFLLLANKNVKILKRLINQILDFRKYENGRMSAILSEADFGKLANEWIESFRVIARKRHIKLTSEISNEHSLRLALDVEKIERVFFNLLSNAFKYTPDNGTIHVICSSDDKNMTFSVADTGCGISEADIHKIFERFYQVDKIHPNGSGIGLSLTKAFIELHGGSITVDSKYGEGSTFTVSIPIRHVDTSWSGNAIAISQKEIEAELDKDEINFGLRAVDSNKPTILIIDDNKDIQKLIIEILGQSYNVMTADNGQAGLKLAAKYIPDLIICDVMMPVMDGLTCCKELKNEISTSHIPVLMLTACSLDEQRVQGYESGADGYLSKPFNGSVLKARCANLISNRKRIYELYKSNSGNNIIGGPDIEKQPISETISHVPYDIDSEFYSNFLSIVSNELGNSELNIEYIASRMGLGQSQFSRKIKSLTNFTPVELIRNLRLKKARTLLTTTEKSMSEIAYEVGFTSPAYFSKCFRDAYGETPSDLRAKLSPKK